MANVVDTAVVNPEIATKHLNTNEKHAFLGFKGERIFIPIEFCMQCTDYKWTIHPVGRDIITQKEYFFAHKP